MRRTLIATTLLITASVSSFPIFAQELRLLTPSERAVYHACLRAAWIDDYCRWQPYAYLSDSGLAYEACLVAHHVQRVPVRGYNVTSRDSCWYLAQRPAH
jgi:hypothetical protein